ncbi:MAG TPA: thiosulfate oxidation carrier protein SoxY [Hyphomicrobium sp.]
MRQRTFPQMNDRLQILVLQRRDFILGAGAAALVAALPDVAGAAHSAEYEAALAALLKGATPREGGIDMDLPANVENGDYVPVALSVDSPMTPESNVKAIHLLSTQNPRASVATFRFTPLSGRARVVSRMRLAKTQEVVAIAELGDGSFLMSTRFVDVKVGGCGI